MPKQKKKDEAPLKKKELLKLHIQELDERLLAATNERNTLAAKLTVLEKTHQDLVTRHSSLVTSEKELVTLHSSLATAFRQLESKHSSLVAERDALVTRHASLIKERDKLHSKAEELDVSLQARFRELAIAARALKEKEDRLEALEPINGQSGVSLASLEILDSHEQPPHRHLNIKLEGVRREGSGSPEDLRFRLIEHHGRPGVAIFGNTTSSGSSVWDFWKETGKESEEAYMLLVPSDHQGARALQEANGLDFYLLQFLLKAVKDKIQRAAGDDNPTGRSRKLGPLAKSSLHAWHSTAIALQAQLAPHANLLRFAAAGPIRWEPHPDALGQATVQLDNVAFAGLFHRHEQVKLTIEASHSWISFPASPMFSSMLPVCSSKIQISHRFKLGQSRILDFPQKPSVTGAAYLASIGRALPRVFLDGGHATFDERIVEKEIRRRVLAMSKQLQSLQA